jgi:hypothetical protein
MAEVLIHIGAHKTATTYIQLTLAALRDRLATRGVVYPSIWHDSNGAPGHVGLANAIRQKHFAQLGQELQCLRKQNDRLLVISAEDLEVLDDAEVGELARLLDGAPVRIVYYVRRWSEALRSTWQESVKHGTPRTLPEFICGHILNANRSPVINFGAVLARYARAFGADRIRVASYSHLTDTGIDIAQHFLTTFLEVTDEELPISGRPNASLNMLDTEVIRVLNCIRTHRTGVISDELGSWYMRRGRAQVGQPLLSAMQEHIGRIDIDESMPPFYEFHRQLRTCYASAVVPPTPVDNLFEPRVTRINYVRADYLTRIMIREIVEYIYQSFARESA